MSGFNVTPKAKHNIGHSCQNVGEGPREKKNLNLNWKKKKLCYVSLIQKKKLFKDTIDEPWSCFGAHQQLPCVVRMRTCDRESIGNLKTHTYTHTASCQLHIRVNNQASKKQQIAMSFTYSVIFLASSVQALLELAEKTRYPLLDTFIFEKPYESLGVSKRLTRDLWPPKRLTGMFFNTPETSIPPPFVFEKLENDNGLA